VDTFLDVIYADMLNDIPRDENHDSNLQRLNSELGVGAWRTPGRPEAAHVESRDPNAPPWWFGDEEASQQFLRDRGVNL
jgi:hypothetical protein